MAGTKAGWAKARATLVAKLGGEEEYLKWRRELGRRGGEVGGRKGFAAMPEEKVREAGRKGGRTPRLKYLQGDELW